MAGNELGTGSAVGAAELAPLAELIAAARSLRRLGIAATRVKKRFFLRGFGLASGAMEPSLVSHSYECSNRIVLASLSDVPGHAEHLAR